MDGLRRELAANIEAMLAKQSFDHLEVLRFHNLEMLRFHNVKLSHTVILCLSGPVQHEQAQSSL